MLSKLVDQLLADEGLRDEFDATPARILERFEIPDAEVEMLLGRDLGELAGVLPPELYRKLVDLSQVGMLDKSYPGPDGVHVDRVEPSVLRAGQRQNLRVWLSLGGQIEPSQAAPRRVVLRLEGVPGPTVEAVASPDVVDIERRYLVTDFTDLRVPRPGRYVLRLYFDNAEIGEATWSRRLHVEEGV